MCPHQPFSLTFGHFLIFKELFAHMKFKIWDILHHSKCKVAGLFWFAHFGMRIFCGGAQLLICYHLVDRSHKYSAHFPSEFDWSKVFLTWHFLVHPSLQFLKSRNTEGCSCPLFPPWDSSFPMFHDLRDKTFSWKLHNQHWVKMHFK